MLGCDPYGFSNLFHEKGLSFCGLKIVVHLGFGHSFHTQNGFDDFGSCRSLNWAYDSLFEIPRCLVCCG